MRRAGPGVRLLSSHVRGPAWAAAMGEGSGAKRSRAEPAIHHSVHAALRAQGWGVGWPSRRQPVFLLSAAAAVVLVLLLGSKGASWLSGSLQNEEGDIGTASSTLDAGSFRNGLGLAAGDEGAQGAAAGAQGAAAGAQGAANADVPEKSTAAADVGSVTQDATPRESRLEPETAQGEGHQQSGQDEAQEQAQVLAQEQAQEQALGEKPRDEAEQQEQGHGEGQTKDSGPGQGQEEDGRQQAGQGSAAGMCEELYALLRSSSSSASSSLQVSTRPGAQCWSHKEWSCLARGPRRAQPSDAMQETLRAYQKHWRQCAAKEDSAQVVQSLLQGRATECQYVLWIPSMHGMGNQVVSLLSAFTYALLTKRILLVGSDATKTMPALFCEPFPDAEPRLPSWVLPEAEKIMAKYGREVPMGAKTPSGPKPDRTWDKPFNFSRDPPRVVAAYIYHRVRLDYLFCDGFHSWLQRASVLAVESNIYWVPALYVLPQFRETLDALVPSRKVFTTLGPALLHPSNEVWQRILAGLQEQQLAWPPQRPDGANGVAGQSVHLGVQYRSAFALQVKDALTDVAVCYEKVKQKENLGGNVVGSSSAQIPRAFLFTLDQPFRDQFAGAVFKDGQGIAAALTKEVEQKSEDLEHNQVALAEILQMALLSDYMVLTPRSTFGYTAFAFSSAKTAFYFSDTCNEAHPEPCFLLPPSSAECYAPWGLSTTDLSNASLPLVSNDHLELCPDESWLFTKLGRNGRWFVTADFPFVQTEGIIVTVP